MISKILTAAILALALAAPAVAQDDAPPPLCAQNFAAYSRLADALLDAALHGQDAYDRFRSENYAPAFAAALASCRSDGRAKQAIYATDAKIATYDAARDLAIGILQSRTPTPVN